jgi:L-lactate dehydrogenase complex protein LldG
METMTGSRDEILNRLRSAARGNETPPPVWRSRRHFDDLAARFTTSLTNVNGEVIQAPSLDEALDRLGELLQSIEAQRAVVNCEPPFDTFDLSTRWPDVEWFTVGRTPGDLRSFCSTADVGLSGAAAALAETGSVIVTSGPGQSRLATLLPPVHIAFVPTFCLTADIFTWTAARQGPLPASLNLISGPSKTADIEQTMAIGVHGPKRFIVLLYDK